MVPRNPGPFRAGRMSTKGESQVGRQGLPPDSVEGGEFADPFGDRMILPRAAPHGRDHDVLGSMFRRYEFNHPGPVSGPFQKLGSQSVGDEFGVALLEYPVPERVRQNRRGNKLGPDLLLAARGHNEQRGSR